MGTSQSLYMQEDKVTLPFATSYLTGRLKTQPAFAIFASAVGAAIADY